VAFMSFGENPTGIPRVGLLVSSLRNLRKPRIWSNHPRGDQVDLCDCLKPSHGSRTPHGEVFPIFTCDRCPRGWQDPDTAVQPFREAKYRLTPKTTLYKNRSLSSVGLSTNTPVSPSVYEHCTKKQRAANCL
jgi:hypothetical protein